MKYNSKDILALAQKFEALANKGLEEGIVKNATVFPVTCMHEKCFKRDGLIELSFSDGKTATYCPPHLDYWKGEQKRIRNDIKEIVSESQYVPEMAEKFEALAKKKKKKKTIRTCMHTGCKTKEELIQVLWADGRARAIFCGSHLEPWKKEDEREIVWEKPYDPEQEKKASVVALAKKKGKGKGKKKNIPTNKALWGRAKAEAKKKFDVYPSVYANAWAAKWYKGKGGGWRKGNAADDGLADDSYTDDELQSWYGDSNDVFVNEDGDLEAHGKVHSDSGLGKWFNKEGPKGKGKGSGWVDICRKENGKHPPCGRPDADKGSYPKCRPAGEASKMSDKAKQNACKEKRRKEKTKKRDGKKPIYTSHKKRD